VKLAPWIAVGGWIIKKSETQPMVVEFAHFAVTKFKPAKTVLASVVKNPARTLLLVDFLSLGVLLLQLDDEPPDPGQAFLQTKDNDTSVHILSRAAVCFGSDRGKKNDDICTYSLRVCLITEEEEVVLFTVGQRVSHLKMLCQPEPFGMPALEHIGQPGKISAVFVPLIAMFRNNKSLGLSDMISALHALSSMAPGESSTYTAMSEVSSLLGNRLASHAEGEGESHKHDRPIVLYGNEDMASQERVRVVSDAQCGAAAGRMEGVEYLEAISLGPLIN
jgi:hypothetical protein